ncbi:hypothetical protein L1S34_12050 [Flavobacterium sp. K77]|uniref:hypothetical protein n=1 Tax=Flavobacterium sp. K77 TaxID=2910676 RepID=UPI001F20A23D|nr:hypothetical protein [Flavobacterium sp. K77]MCF6142020.1 hypothetical protein [Flavobacterium sp. K77]
MLEDFSFIGLILIPVIFFISRKALRERQTFLIILCVCIFCGILAILNLESAENGKPNFALIWFCPLYSLLLYRILLIAFWARKKRDPKIPQLELFYNGNVDFFADRLFGLIFIILSIMLPMYLITKNYL